MTAPQPLSDILDGVSIPFAYKLGYMINTYREPSFRSIEARHGLTRPEIDAGWPGYLDEGSRPEGFESYDDVAERITDAIGAAAVVTLSVLLARHHLFEAIRYCGQNSIVIYLAFFLPMATARRPRSTSLLSIGIRPSSR